MNARYFLAMSLTIAWASAYAPAGEPSREEKTVQEMFGKRLAAVRASATEDDDLALARDMILVAADGGTSDGLRYTLACGALDLLLSMTSSDAAAEPFRAAIELAESVRPLPPAYKSAMQRDVAMRQLAAAKGKKSEEIAPLAKAAIDAQLAYANLMGGDINHMKEVEAALTTARSIAVNNRLDSLRASVETAISDFNASKTRRIRQAALEAKLKAAQDAKDATAIWIAKRALAQVCIETEGDLAAAAGYLAGSTDPRDKAILAAGEFLANPDKLDVANCLSVADALATMGRPLGDAARQKIYACGGRMCQAFMETNPPEVAAARAKVLLTQMLGVAPPKPPTGETLRKKIEDVYGPLHGKLDLLDGKRIRLTYDFSDANQLADWVAKGEWTCQSGCVGHNNDPTDSAGMMQPPALSLKIRFLALKPLGIAFVARATGESGGIVEFFDGKKTPLYASFFHLGHGIGGVRAMDQDSLVPTSYDSYLKLIDKEPVKYEIGVDGAKGNATWGLASPSGSRKLNYKLAQTLDDRPAGTLGLKLAGGIRKSSYVTFSNVVVEGDVALTAPDETPAKHVSKTASPKKPG